MNDPDRITKPTYSNVNPERDYRPPDISHLGYRPRTDAHISLRSPRQTPLEPRGIVHRPSETKEADARARSNQQRMQAARAFGRAIIALIHADPSREWTAPELIQAVEPGSTRRQIGKFLEKQIADGKIAWRWTGHARCSLKGYRSTKTGAPQ